MKTGLHLAAFALAIAGLWSCSENAVDSPPDFGQVVGVQWRLVAIDSDSGTRAFLHPADTVFLLFEVPRTARGISQGRCGNRCQAVYTLGDGNGVLLDSLSSTEMACPDSRYWEFFTALYEVDAFDVSDSRLFLYRAASARGMVFERN